jgi:hypothetical protein
MRDALTVVELVMFGGIPMVADMNIAKNISNRLRDRLGMSTTSELVLGERDAITGEEAA